MSVGSWPSTSDAEVPHAIFTVKVHAQMLKAPEALPVASNRHSVRVARAVHAYNLFIKIEVKRLRTWTARGRLPMLGRSLLPAGQPRR